MDAKEKTFIAKAREGAQRKDTFELRLRRCPLRCR